MADDSEFEPEKSAEMVRTQELRSPVTVEELIPEVHKSLERRRMQRKLLIDKIVNILQSVGMKTDEKSHDKVIRNRIATRLGVPVDSITDEFVKALTKKRTGEFEKHQAEEAERTGTEFVKPSQEFWDEVARRSADLAGRKL